MHSDFCQVLRYGAIMLRELSLGQIFQDQQKSLKGSKNGWMLGDYFLLWIFPLIMSCILITHDIKSASSNLITILSIFCGLLFNFLILLFSLAEKTDRANSPNRYNFLKEVISNVGYAISFSIFSIFAHFFISLDFNFLIDVYSLEFQF